MLFFLSFLLATLPAILLPPGHILYELLPLVIVKITPERVLNLLEPSVLNIIIKIHVAYSGLLHSLKLGLHLYKVVPQGRIHIKHLPVLELQNFLQALGLSSGGFFCRRDFFFLILSGGNQGKSGHAKCRKNYLFHFAQIFYRFATTNVEININNSKMKVKSIMGILAASALIIGFVQTKADACTNIIVTKGASADGSLLISYAADSHGLFGELYFQPAKDWKPGSKRRIVDWDSGRFLGEIDQVPHTYKRVGNMNEHQLIIGETTFGGRHELHDKKGGIDYGSLIYIALERCRTAREAIQCITSLANEYGYYSDGESFSIADKEEAWILEMIGKGTNLRNGRNINKGVVWVAVRIPDGYISGHANQARITTFPLNDPDNCLYAKDVISFARKQGYFEGEDEDFSFADAYCPLDFSGLRACEARVWSAFNILCGGWFTFEDENGRMVTKDAYTYFDYATGANPKNRMPLYVLPQEKISVKNVADAMRDHYEGTPIDMTQDIGAGGNALPYRWRPMHFEYDGKQYLNERAIATQQTGFWFVGQSRPSLPDVIGGIIWFGTDDAATSYLTPIYTNTEEVPECFAVGNGNMITYSPTSSFWLNNRVANACYKMYNYMAPFVRERIDKFENDQLEAIHKADLTALDLYVDIADKQSARHKGDGYDPKTDTGDAFLRVKDFLTNYSVSTAQNQFSAWKKLEETLLVKFIDGNIKAQNEDGSFKHNEYSESIPADIKSAGYTELWKAVVAEQNGEILKVLEVPQE